LCAGHEHPRFGADREQEKPNIVFILVDNIGWGDFSVYGGTTPTPRIDALANSGIRDSPMNLLTNGFVNNCGRLFGPSEQFEADIVE
jgi:hypothetical protein